MLNIKTKQVIDVGGWNNLVESTYGKPYNFQQQDGCQPRGNFPIKIPDYAEDYENDIIPDVINGDEMGVSFKAWLARDVEFWCGDENKRSYFKRLFWGRNFYPDVQMVANDLHAKGLIPAGEYVIEIDW